MSWFITSIATEKDKNNGLVLKVHRTFGFFHEKANALSAVRTSEGYMEDSWYDYLVIEHIEEGIHSLADEEIWFKWSVWRPSPGVNPISHWIPCDKPMEFKNIINWALG